MPGVMRRAVLALFLCLPAGRVRADAAALVASGETFRCVVHEVTPETVLLVDARTQVRRVPPSDFSLITFEARPALLHLRNERQPLKVTPVQYTNNFLCCRTDQGQQFFLLDRVVSLQGERLTPIRSIGEVEVRQSLREMAVPGKITVFFFRVPGWIVPIIAQTEKLARADPEVCLRWIDIREWNSEIARRFQVESLPDLRVYDRDINPYGTPCTTLVRVQRYIDELKNGN